MMAKSEYKIRWWEFMVMSVLSMLLSFAVAFKWFSFMIGDRTYSELGSSKTSGLVYAVAKLEGSSWRFLLVAMFFGLSILFFSEGKKKRNSK